MTIASPAGAALHLELVQTVNIAPGLTADDFKTKCKKLSAQANTTDAQVAESIVGKDNVIAYDSFAASLIALKK